MDNITETEQDHLCNSYIDQKIHNTPSNQTIMGYPYYRQYTKLNVSPERNQAVPSTGGSLWLHPLPTATDMLWKKVRVPESIGDPIKYTKYKTGNEVLFRGLDIGLIESSLCVKVEEHILTKDVRAVFLDIGD